MLQLEGYYKQISSITEEFLMTLLISAIAKYLHLLITFLIKRHQCVCLYSLFVKIMQSWLQQLEASPLSRQNY